MDYSKANCIGVDPELFFPKDTSITKYEAQIAEAKKVCSDCPIKMDCLRLAIENDEFGIWGGTTERERDKLRKNFRVTSK